MIFTIISILLYGFEYLLSSKFIMKESIMVIKFEFETNRISSLSQVKFGQKVIFDHRKDLIHFMSKTIHVNSEQVERLLPTQSNNGAKFTFIIDSDRIHFDHIWQLFYDSVDSKTFAYYLQKKIFKLKRQCVIDTNKICQLRLNGLDAINDNNSNINSNVDSRKPVALPSISPASSNYEDDDSIRINDGLDLDTSVYGYNYNNETEKPTSANNDLN